MKRLHIANSAQPDTRKGPHARGMPERSLQVTPGSHPERLPGKTILTGSRRMQAETHGSGSGYNIDSVSVTKCSSFKKIKGCFSLVNSE